jgi:hypothetical protein
MRFLADENFNGAIVRGVQRQVPDIEIIRVQDTELYSKPDSDVLAWAAESGYILLTHDIKTMPGFFYQRVESNLPVPGVFAVHNDQPIGKVIDDLVLLILATHESEWLGTIRYLPL